MILFVSFSSLKKAFTLIELLIVIVIIGILATALIPRFTGAQDKARYARAEKDFRDLRTAIFLAQTNTNKPLKDITGQGCTSCACGVMVSGSISFVGIDFQDFPSSAPCRTAWTSALRKIEQAADMTSGSLSTIDSDPWGAPYYLDENEMEGGNCNTDAIKTMGSDGLNNGPDDRIIRIAPQGCPGSY